MWTWKMGSSATCFGIRDITLKSSLDQVGQFKIKIKYIGFHPGSVSCDSQDGDLLCLSFWHFADCIPVKWCTDSTSLKLKLTWWFVMRFSKWPSSGLLSLAFGKSHSNPVLDWVLTWQFNFKWNKLKWTCNVM
jgi:hypothetical protein